MKPILFNTDMVRAILDGRKSVTRRVVKPPVMNTIVTPPLQTANKSGLWAFYGEDGLRRAPYRTDDILYIRETWCRVGEDVDKIYFENSCNMWNGMYLYKADGIDLSDAGKWHPSIHMPKEAARIFLRVTDVNVERLQKIDNRGCAQEGIEVSSLEPYFYELYRQRFRRLWDSTIKKSDIPIYGWNANPWCWVIEFQQIEREEALKTEATRNDNRRSNPHS